MGTAGQTGTTAEAFRDVLDHLVRREDLTTAQADVAMRRILAGDATDAQIAAFAVALRAKGETPLELATLVRTALEFAERVDVADPGSLIDTCGTGGDRSGSVNVSTMAAVIAAGAGARVAKHGNRAASSRCGSADVLEALGIVIDLGPVGVARCIDEAGIGFCLAPRFHPAWRHAAAARRDLGVPTTFNYLGPLANPAGVGRQAIGVSDPTMAERSIGALAALGRTHVMVFHGHDGLDELSTAAPSTVHELRHGEVRTFELHPAALGFRAPDPGALEGGDAAANARAVERVLAGETGPVRDIAVLNAAAALVVADRAGDLAAGVDLAGAAIDDGRAIAVLERWRAVSADAREVAP